MPPDGWTHLMAAAGEVRFVHEPFWTRAVCDHLDDHDGRWLLVEQGGRPVAGIPLVVSRKGPLNLWEGHHQGVPTAPLLAEDLPPERRHAVLATLLDGCRQLALGSRVLAFSLYLDPLWDGSLGADLHGLGFRRSAVSTAGLPLIGGIDQVERTVLKKNRRNERNRALKMGCKAEISTAPEDLDAFQAIHAEAARRWGVPTVPAAMIRQLVSEGAGKVFLSLVRFEDRLIGGHFCWHDGDEIFAWLGATLPQHNDKFPATLLIWNDLEEACRRGASWLDLGGSGGLEGVSNFKKLLGAEERERGAWSLAPWSGRLLRGVHGLVTRRGRA